MVRTARQILVDKKFLNNSNMSAKVGTVENRNSPDTVYLEATFWVQPKNLYENTDVLKKKIHKDLKDIYKNDLAKKLQNNRIFTKFDDNLFILNIPENLNHNKKRNFVSIELYLHTQNIDNEELKLPLKKDPNSPLFKECLEVMDIISKSEFLQGKLDFDVFLRK